MITTIPHLNLLPYNTFKMNVKCDEWIEYDSLSDLPSIASGLHNRKWMHIGGGSNLLFTGDYEGILLHSRIYGIEAHIISDSAVRLDVGSGIVMDDLIQWACSRGLWGIENLSDIPGEVGAAAVQNVGAYGVEIKDVIETVRCYDVLSNRHLEFSNVDCQYAYRDSLFKRPENKKRYIITSLSLILSRHPDPRLDYGNLRAQLSSQSPLTPMAVREAVIRVRRDKLPPVDQIGSAGSFFKNPVVDRRQFQSIEGYESVPHYEVGEKIKIPAAWLIDQCGFKGRQVGGAAVWARQPLIIVNQSGSASPADVLALESEIIEKVKARFGVELHPEVDHI